MAGDVILLAASFAVILAGALLFTNAVEWLGHRLSIGEGAVGSLLAAVGTAMPESFIPIVAVIGGAEGSADVAIGAIVGAPFLLATIAMVRVGPAALGCPNRREQGRHLRAHVPTLDRDLTVFLVFFAIAVLLGIGLPLGLRIVAAVALVLAYAIYVQRTIAGGGELQPEETLGPLIISRTRGDDPTMRAIVTQFVIGLAAMIGGAHLFVEELPEKANSFFWVRDGKDALALGNITGAMVFQSMIPIAIGLAFTDWDLDRFAVLSIVLGLAGGIVAYWALRLRGQFNAPAILAWGGLYAIFLGFVIAEG